MSKSREISFEEFINQLEYDLFMVGKYKIDTIRYYLTTVDKYFIARSLEIEKEISEYQSNNDILDPSRMTIFIEDYQDFNKGFKKLKLESTFITTYSLFENYLKSLTENYMKYFEFNISADDLSGTNYISKSKKYLEKVVGLDLSKTDKLWSSITKYQKIRNKIAHNNSRFGNNQSELTKELSQLEGIVIDSNGWIKLNDKIFVFNFLKIFENYIYQIIKITIEHEKNKPVGNKT
ncbi:hypothetical protein SAMN04488007_3479 [Maribacter aquivivus]|uniref:Cthe-2314-like HEPN domain-containing protein n=1 Tax=Maribacter aquivivus TaxID=228958 RepID=A0A1M6U4D9_9FLAO|nr:hypothetical protein [Maribacter aquivivus]SHK64011.1 hypothetical protein SAMN04488007_3479 [Maribacter aquivivus]